MHILAYAYRLINKSTHYTDMNHYTARHLISGIFLSLSLILLSLQPANAAYKVTSFESGDAEIDVRVFKADGDKLLLGFACDQGSSVAEEATASTLAKDGIEVWMPDMLSAYMLPKLRSSLYDIPTDGLEKILEAAVKTGKKIYLVASGPDTELILRLAQDWESKHKDTPLGGALLMFPRLNKAKPEPGKPPVYQDAVGKTHLPLMVLEGERTPNRWGVGHLTNALKKGGSTVYAKLIPDVRGYFFKRNDPNVPEDLVTTQMSGLIKASLFFLGRAH